MGVNNKSWDRICQRFVALALVAAPNPCERHAVREQVLRPAQWQTCGGFRVSCSIGDSCVMVDSMMTVLSCERRFMCAPVCDAEELHSNY